MKSLHHSLSTTHNPAVSRVAREWCCGTVLALAAFLGGAAQLPAQTTNFQGWDLEHAVLDIHGFPSSAATSSSGAIYVAGLSQTEVPPGSGQWVYTSMLLRSEDRANSWLALPNPPAGLVAEISDLTIGNVPQADGSAEEQVFALGTRFNPATGQSHVEGVYRYRPSAGSEPELITPAPIANQSLKGLAVDTSGNVYVLAFRNVTTQTKKGSSTISYALLVKGTRDLASGTYTWATAADFGANSTAEDVLCVGSSVIVVGSLNSIWQVNKCVPNSTGGLTLTAIDAGFTLSSGQTSAARMIAADQAGGLIVIGFSYGKTSGTAVARKGTVNGVFKTISTFDSFAPRGVTVDPAGIVHVLGENAATSGRPRQPWVTRQGKEINGVWSWLQSDGGWNYTLTGDAPTARAIASDSAGNVYAVGMTRYREDGYVMLRRRLAENAPTP